jgi:hypothetical protein
MIETIIKINVLEVASELANHELEENWRDTIKIYEDDQAGITVYTDEAQDIFNELYDKYSNFLYALKEK